MCQNCLDSSCSGCNPILVERGPKGDTGATGSQGIAGYNGWSALIVLIQNDGVTENTGGLYSLKFSSWTGGTGAPPATPTAPNIYLQSNGTFGALLTAVNLIGPAGNTMVWKGTLASAPVSPNLLWAYRDSGLKKAFIWDGTSWQEMVEDGLAGSTGSAGANGISIVWKGALAAAPGAPSLNWGYYDTVQKKSFIWDGAAWQIIAIDGTNGSNGTNGFNYETVDGNGVHAAGIGNPYSLLIRRPDDTGYIFQSFSQLRADLLYPLDFQQF